MNIDLMHFTPGLSLTGGVIIGLAVAVLLLFNGRIAGISGVVGNLLTFPSGDMAWRVAFLVGLIAAPAVLGVFHVATHVQLDASGSQIVIAGFLVGIGTRFAGGCTSGHGVCGLSRGSVRSVAATASFMLAGFLTVFVIRHLLGA
jgi:uncharacterized protein